MDVYQQIKKSVNLSPVLVVDDDEMIRLYLETYLLDAGFQDVRFAENGIEALEKIEAERPACVVLDINMPVMDGNEVLQRIRTQERTADLPVLVVTGHDSHKERNAILKAGASNLISKPIDGDVFTERVINLVERGLLFGQLKSFHDRLSSELASAAEMQAHLLPTETQIASITERYGVKLASHSRPSSELGGDFWAVQEIDDGHFGVLIVDFSGHGVSAALNTFRLHTVMNRIEPSGTSPAAYVDAINSEIADIMPSGQYCTMLYAVIDMAGDKMTYAGAASTSPLFGSAASPEIQVGDGSGLPVGIRRHSGYQDHVVDFPEGSFLFLYSDALLETELDDGKALETEGIVDLVKACKQADANASLDGILNTFYEKAPKPLPDDLTALWLSR